MALDACRSVSFDPIEARPHGQKIRPRIECRISRQCRATSLHRGLSPPHPTRLAPCRTRRCPTPGICSIITVGASSAAETAPFWCASVAQAATARGCPTPYSRFVREIPSTATGKRAVLSRSGDDRDTGDEEGFRSSPYLYVISPSPPISGVSRHRGWRVCAQGRPCALRADAGPGANEPRRSECRRVARRTRWRRLFDAAIAAAGRPRGQSRRRPRGRTMVRSEFGTAPM